MTKAPCPWGTLLYVVHDYFHNSGENLRNYIIFSTSAIQNPTKGDVGLSEILGKNLPCLQNGITFCTVKGTKTLPRPLVICFLFSEKKMYKLSSCFEKKLQKTFFVNASFRKIYHTIQKLQKSEKKK